ncbi:MAG TPA: ABC transporter permease [Gammaproteobacteria bacterium]|nr:ABC transporter permease [Gammaproteobacteria bacterium]
MLWRQLARGLRALTQRSVVDEELDEEVRDYFERARSELEREGLSAEQAARAARQKLGDQDRARETLRSYGWENAVESLLADLRYALRGLRRSPGFAAVAALTLALGIGAGTAIVSVARPILFSSLPYPDPDRIVMLSDVTAEGTPFAVTYGTYAELSQRSRSFESLAVGDRWAPALAAGAGEPERLDGDRVSAGFFRVLHVAPAFGRDFTPEDAAVGAPGVVIVTSRLATRRFGSPRAVLGRPVRLDGNAYTVIGVMPAGFENVLSPRVDVWAPLQYRTAAPFQSAEWGHHLRMAGRLAPGVSAEQARREILGIGASPSADFPRPPWAALRSGLIVEPLQHAVARDVQGVLVAILGAVLLLLVIACVNVGNLLLARGFERQNELAVRAVLGAGQLRIVRQLLTESVLLAILGGALGIGVAALGIRVLLALAPAGLPRIAAVRLDGSAFSFALALTAVVGLGVGLVPALLAVRRGGRPGLGSGPRSVGASAHRVRRALVVTQVALAVVLLAGAGLLLRSVERLLSTPPGFDVAHVLTMQIVATGRRFESDGVALKYFEQTLDAVRAVPGVADAALTSQLPLSGDLEGYGVVFEGAQDRYPLAAEGVLRYAVTPDVFRTLRIPLRRGRLLDASDKPGAPEAVLISESFAKRRFGDRDPIGQHVRFGPDTLREDGRWRTIVGVVGDVKQTSLALGAPDAFYVAAGQWQWVDVVQSLVVRTKGDPTALAASVKRAIWSVDPTVPVERVAAMQDLLAASEAQRRFALTVFTAFAGAALLLAALGLYGVIAGGVAERTREFGLRTALGASSHSIVRLVVRQGMALAAAGIAIGALGAAGAARGLSTLLYDVSTVDPLTYAAVIALLAGVAAAACWAPAWRAARVDPSVALRSE